MRGSWAEARRDGRRPLVSTLADRASGIGVITDFDWQGAGAPLRHPSDLAFFGMVEAALGGPGLVLVDWRSLEENGTAIVMMPRLGVPIRLEMREVCRVVHLYRVGHGRCRTDTLAEKWHFLLARLGCLDGTTIRIINSLPVVRAACRKDYLARLVALGIPTVPTALVPTAAPFAAVAGRFDGRPHVVKPINGECGRFVMRLDAMDDRAWGVLGQHADTALVQPYLPDWHRLERALLFLSGRFAYGVSKRTDREPSGLGARVATRRAGPYDPTAAEIRLGERVLESFCERPEIARVDLVGPINAPVVAEIEAADPGFLRARDRDFASDLAAFYRRVLTESDLGSAAPRAS